MREKLTNAVQVLGLVTGLATVAVVASPAAVPVAFAQSLDAGATVEAVPAPLVAEPVADAEPETDSSNVVENVSGFAEAVHAGKWLLAFGFLLLVLAVVVRKLTALVNRSWAESKTGGKIVGGLTGLMTTLGVGIVETGSITWELGALAIAAAGTAAGLWSLAPSGVKERVRVGRRGD